jgi:hypothetical protein
MSRRVFGLVETRHIFYLILTIIIVVTVFVPVTIPLRTTDYVQDAYDAIEMLEPGDLVCDSASAITMYGFEESRGSYVAMVRHCLDKGANIIVWAKTDTFYGYKLILWKEALYGIPMEEHPDYGTRFVNLGYIAGQAEVIIPSLLQDIRGIRTTDAYGNSLNDFAKLPLMQDVDSLMQCRLIFGGYLDPYLVITGPMTMDDPIMFVYGHTGSGSLPNLVVYYKANLIAGCVSGARASAEYEFLTGYPGIASERMIQTVSTTAVVMAGSILTTVIYVVRGRKVERLLDER